MESITKIKAFYKYYLFICVLMVCQKIWPTEAICFIQVYNPVLHLVVNDLTLGPKSGTLQVLRFKLMVTRAFYETYKQLKASCVKRQPFVGKKKAMTRWCSEEMLLLCLMTMTACLKGFKKRGIHSYTYTVYITHSA